MVDQDLIVLIALLSFTTLLLRTAPLTFLAHLRFPPVVRKSLDYVPVTILSALLTSEIFMKKGELALTFSNPTLWAAAISFVVAFYYRSFLATVGLGIVAAAILHLV